MPQVFVERNFAQLFEQFGGYFARYLSDIGWDVFFYKDNPPVFPDLVTRFYESIPPSEVDRINKIIRVRWDDDRIFEITPEVISVVIGIPLLDAPSPPSELSQLALFMGPKVKMSSRSGIETKGMYRNVHLMTRWIQRNLVSSGHHSTAHVPTLQMIHGLMHRTPPCICSFIFDSIANVRLKKRNYAVPALIMMIMKNFLPTPEFRRFEYGPVELVREEIISHRYRQSKVMWTPADLREDIHQTETNSSSASSSSSFPSLSDADEPNTSKAPPRACRHSSSTRTDEALKKIAKMCKKVYNKMTEIKKDLEEMKQEQAILRRNEEEFMRG